MVEHLLFFFSEMFTINENRFFCTLVSDKKTLFGLFVIVNVIGTNSLLPHVTELKDRTWWAGV